MCAAAGAHLESAGVMCSRGGARRHREGNGKGETRRHAVVIGNGDEQQPLPVCLVDVRDLWNQRVVGVRVRQQGADGQQHLHRM